MKAPSNTYALFCPPALGHLNPFMALARELKVRGHKVIFYQLRDYEALLTRYGFEVRVYGEKEFPVGAWRAISEQFATLSGERAMAHFIEAVERKTRSGLAELPGLIREGCVDAIISDQIGLESSSIAEVLDLPFATLCNALPLDSDSTTPPFFTDWTPSRTAAARLRNWLGYKALDVKIEPTLKIVNEWRLKQGLSPLGHRRDSYSKLLKMIRLHRELDFPRRVDSQTHWVGPLVLDAGRVECPFPWDRLNGKPLVYVSMGSEINRRFASFQLIIEALESEDIQLVVSMGRDGADTKVLAHGSSTIIRAFVPQTEILRKASLFVTHGGLNSVLESICAGVPVMALPSANDQFGISARIRHHGIGDYLLEQELTVERLRDHYRRIAADHQMHGRLQKLASGTSAEQAAIKAADLIERLATTRNSAHARRGAL